jgi:hypothetical protein
MSSGCVLRKVSQLFTCEKNCNSVEARKALLEDFTSKVYNAEVVYVGSDGKTTEENYTISFKLSEKQKDSTMNRIHGFAILQKEEETPITLAWSGIYLAKKGGYKMRVSDDNMEKDFYVYCGGNEKINFLIKKTVSEDLTVRGSRRGRGLGVGSMNIDECPINCKKGCNGDTNCESLCPDYCRCNSQASVPGGCFPLPANCLQECSSSTEKCIAFCKCAYLHGSNNCNESGQYIGGGGGGW